MKNIGIYVHIPYCKRKCKYCDFTSFDNKNNVDDYVKSVIYEIENIDKKIKYLEDKNNKKSDEDFCIDTIYFGGGTPSYIEETHIEKILEKIREKFNVEKDAEITIEINPGTASEEKIKKYKEIGINRVSIGLQTANNDLLKLIGRIHTYEEFIYTYNLCKENGFKNINVDLMLALPNQTEKDLKETLLKVINLSPTHISLYSLILEENTELEKLVSAGKLSLPEEDIERKMYWDTKRILEKNKYYQYEISNFAKQGKESKHNVNCWKQHEYLGFGISAHSYFNDIRFSNTSNLENYIKNDVIENIEIQEIQDKKSKMKEFMMIGLRMIDGVSISNFEQKFGINPIFYFRFELNELVKKQLLEINLDNIKLTKKGLDFANIVFEKFV